jgi:hypothetical protein
LPEVFNNKWYVHWGRLEEILALGMEHEHCDEVLENVKVLEILVDEVLNSADEQAEVV